jgi:hypothetical protein
MELKSDCVEINTTGCDITHCCKLQKEPGTTQPWKDTPMRTNIRKSLVGELWIFQFMHQDSASIESFSLNRVERGRTLPPKSRFSLETIRNCGAQGVTTISFTVEQQQTESGEETTGLFRNQVFCSWQSWRAGSGCRCWLAVRMEIGGVHCPHPRIFQLRDLASFYQKVARSHHYAARTPRRNTSENLIASWRCYFCHR